jgi:hypothetical protein
MGKIIFNRGFDKAIKKGTTASPTITEVSTTFESITFNLTNNDAAEATLYYDLDSIAELDTDNVVLAPATTSDDITISGLDLDTEYNVFAVASAVGKRFSPETSLAITTDEEPPIPEFELLFDSDDEVTLPQTQIDITGLSIGKNDELRLVYTITPAASISGDLRVFPNDLTTLTNYHNQYLRGNGSTISAVRANSNSIASAEHDNIAQGFADIKVSNNDRFVVQSQQLRAFGSAANFIQQWNYNLVGTQTVTSITKLTVSHSVTDGIGTGSRIRLYKVNTGEA